MIDAADISEVAVQLDGGVTHDDLHPSGKITISTDKTLYEAGSDILVTVTGKDLKGVNALNLSLPYNERDMQFVKVDPIAVKDMRNMTNDRLHNNGEKVLYPTFVNVGDIPSLNGNADLFVVRFKALRRIKMPTWLPKGMLVSKSLDVSEV